MIERKSEQNRKIMRKYGPELKWNYPCFCNSIFFIIQFNLDLIGRKVNHQADIFTVENTKFNKISFGTSSHFSWFFYSTWEFCPTGHGIFHVTEAGYANLYGVVACLKGEKPPLRGAGPPEQSQRDLRRSLAQLNRLRRLKNDRGRRKPSFHPYLPPKPLEHRLGNDFDQKFNRCIPVVAARVGLRGCASPLKRFQVP